MAYRFLLFVSLLFVTITYIATDGTPHNPVSSRGDHSWDTGDAVWQMCTDASADHQTITAYASANVTTYQDPDANGSGSGGEDDLQAALGHARVSASTVTITINGKSETHEPDGMASHVASIYLINEDTYETQGPWKKGDNDDYTDYEGEYNEATSAYNNEGFDPGPWHLMGVGNGSISNSTEALLNNITEAHTSASAW